VLLLPSEPSLLEPQHQTPPSFNAQLWFSPALIAVTPLSRPDTGTGTRLDTCEGSLGPPPTPLPQHQTPPSFSAQVRLRPALIASAPAGPAWARGPLSPRNGETATIATRPMKKTNRFMSWTPCRAPATAVGSMTAEPCSVELSGERCGVAKCHPPSSLYAAIHSYSW
jgi:hypothetical protein